MESSAMISPPRRVADLINLKNQGIALSVNPSFEIVPVNFAHESVPYKAHIFLCRYAGTFDSKEFMFRKCYAKGCHHNLCPHVAQAVMIANRYLQRDYKRLRDADITLEEKLFSLEEMMVKYEEGEEGAESGATGGVLTIHDYINIAKEGNRVEVRINLDIIPAVEHFANRQNKQSFLMSGFTISTLGSINKFERCLACFQTDQEHIEKTDAIKTANERLKLLYNEFDGAQIDYQSVFF